MSGSRRGLALTELLVASALAVAILGAAFAIAAMTARAERRTSGGAEAAEQAALAREVLAADLARMYVDPAHYPLLVRDDGQAVAFHVLPDAWGQPVRPVEWTFSDGRLVRADPAGSDRAFVLGAGARVAFVLADGVQFCITACADAPGGTAALTLVGSAPVAPAPLTDFPFWNAQP